MRTNKTSNKEQWPPVNDIVTNFAVLHMRSLKDRNELSSRTKALHNNIFKKERSLLALMETTYRLYDHLIRIYEACGDQYTDMIDMLKIFQTNYDWHPVTIKPLNPAERKAMMKPLNKTTLFDYAVHKLCVLENQEELKSKLAALNAIARAKGLEVVELMASLHTLSDYAIRLYEGYDVAKQEDGAAVMIQLLEQHLQIYNWAPLKN